MLQLFSVSLLLIVLGMLNGLGMPNAEAEIYRWINANGVACFGNIPPVGIRLRDLERREEAASPVIVAGAEVREETSETSDSPTMAMEDDAEATESTLIASGEEEAPMEDGEGEEQLGTSLAVTDLPVYLARTVVAETPESQVQLPKAYLSEVMLQESDLTEVDFSEANFVNSNLQGAILDDGNFQRAFFVNANLRGVSAVGADLQQARLQGANLRAVNFQDSDLRGAIFSGANLAGADLTDADLSGADLRGAYGITPEQLATAYLDDETQLSEFNASPVYFSGAAPALVFP
jgi:uncharacterized protein YjbI with pentapeptide repeats